MAVYITVLNYVYSLCVFYYSVLSCVADVADCPLQRLSAVVIKRHYYYYYYNQPDRPPRHMNQFAELSAVVDMD